MSNVHGTICNTLFLIMSFLIVSFTLSAAETDSYMTQSRLAAKQFAEELKAELMSAIENGGPINAVSVCEEKAPAIAEKISNDKGWAVGRTSLKFRNPTNAPDGWEKKVLANFEKQKSKGESLDSLEYGEVVTVNGKKQFRYMRAILTQKPCLT